MRLVSIALDSIDNLHYGCTTHFSTILLKNLSRKIRLADLPLLVRLNPAIPWKTRGNGAVVLRILYEGDIRELLETVYNLALEYSSGKEDVGIVVYEGEPWSVRELRWLYYRTLTNVITRDVVLRILGKLGGLHAGRRGVIGAAASLAALGPKDDFTFELLAYRNPDLWGSERCVDIPKVLELEALMPPCTFYNLSLLTGELLATPGGTDPVLAGFRGDCITPLFDYSRALCEKPDAWLLFRSNQHTDPHDLELEELSYYTSGSLEAIVENRPNIIEGGHVIVRVSSELGEADLVFYRETGSLNRIARLLEPGDRIRVLGSTRPYKPRGVPVIAVEKLWVLSVERKYVVVNPRCPKCGSRMKSSGSNKGFKCDSCGYRILSASKINLEIERTLAPGEYVTERFRHLTAPVGRRRFAGIQLPLNLDVEDILSLEANPKPSERLRELEFSLAKL